MNVDRAIAWFATGCAIFSAVYFLTNAVLIWQWRGEATHRSCDSAISLPM